MSMQSPDTIVSSVKPGSRILKATKKPKVAIQGLKQSNQLDLPQESRNIPIPAPQLTSPGVIQLPPKIPVVRNSSSRASGNEKSTKVGNAVSNSSGRDSGIAKLTEVVGITDSQLPFKALSDKAIMVSKTNAVKSAAKATILPLTVEAPNQLNADEQDEEWNESDEGEEDEEVEEEYEDHRQTESEPFDPAAAEKELLTLSKISAYYVRKMFLLHVEGQKKRKGASFLFENLRTLILLLSWDELTEDGTVKAGNTAAIMYTKIYELLQTMPDEPDHQREIFHYLLSSDLYTEEFDPNLEYEWPEGFVDYVFTSMIPQTKNKNQVDSQAQLDIDNQLQESIGEKMRHFAKKSKSAVTKDINRKWNKLKSTETLSEKLERMRLELWRQNVIESSRENTRKNAKKNSEFSKLQSCSLEDAKAHNIAMAIKAAQKIAESTSNCPEWYPAHWIYFLRCVLAAEVGRRNRSTVKTFPELLNTKGEARKRTAEKVKAFVSRNSAEGKKRKYADSFADGDDSEVTFESAKRDVNVVLPVAQSSVAKAQSSIEKTLSTKDQKIEEYKRYLASAEEFLKIPFLSEKRRKAAQKNVEKIHWKLLKLYQPCDEEDDEDSSRDNDSDNEQS